MYAGVETFNEEEGKTEVTPRQPQGIGSFSIRVEKGQGSLNLESQRGTLQGQRSDVGR